MLCLLAPLAGRARGAGQPQFVRTIGTTAPLGSLNEPLGIAYAPGESGLIYVVDSGNARVQVFRPGGEPVGMWGERGNLPGQLWRPIDIDVSPDGRYAYVVDRRHRLIQQYETSPRCLQSARGCFVRAWGGWGTGPGQFQEPVGIAVDRRGHVFVADWGAHVVQVFDADGSYVNTIGTFGYNPGQIFRPSDVEISPDGKVWVADRDNDRISIFETDGAFAGLFKAGARLHYPTGIALDGEGNFAIQDYEPDTGHARVRMFSAERKQLGETVLGGNGNLTSHPFQGMTMLPDGSAVLAVPGDDEFNLIALSPGGDRQPLASRGRDLSQFVFPRAVAIDPHFLAVVDAGNRRVLVIDPANDDVLVGIMGDLNPDFDFEDPRGIAVQRLSEEPDDAVILVADPRRNRIFRGTPAGEWRQPWTGGLNQPFDVAVSEAGDVFVADTGNDRIVRYWPDGQQRGTIGERGKEPGQMIQPAAITVGPHGWVYVLEQTVGRLQAFSPEGALQAHWPGGDTRDVAPGKLWRPIDLASDGTYLYVLENESVANGASEHVRVQVFEPDPDKTLADCLVTVFASTQGAGTGQLWNPRGLDVSPDGWVAAADSGNNRVQLFHWYPETLPVPVPTETPTPTPSPTPTDSPTSEPPPTATAEPTDDPGPSPSPPEPYEPTSTPRGDTTAVPTVEPTTAPTEEAPPPSATVSTPSADRQPTPAAPRPTYILLPLAVR